MQSGELRGHAGHQIPFIHFARKKVVPIERGAGGIKIKVRGTEYTVSGTDLRQDLPGDRVQFQDATPVRFGGEEPALWAEVYGGRSMERRAALDDAHVKVRVRPCPCGHGEGQ